MWRVYMPGPDPIAAEYLPWRLAGMGVMLCSAMATTLLYVHLAKLVISSLAG